MIESQWTHIKAFIKMSVEKHRLLFACILLLVIVVKSASITLPFLLGEIIDVLNSENYGNIPHWIFAFSGILLILAIVSPIQSLLLSRFVQKVIYESSIDWVKNILKKDFPFFSQLRIGQIVNATDRGIAAHEKLLSYFCESLFPLSIELLICVGALFYLGGIKVSGLVSLILILQILSTRVIIRARRSQVQQLNEVEDDLAASLTEVISNGLVVKLERGIRSACQRLKSPFLKYAKAAVRLSFSSSLMNISNPVFLNLTTIAIIFYSLWSLSRGEGSIGGLVTLIAIAGRTSLSVGEVMQTLRFYEHFTLDMQEFLRLQKLDSFEREGDSITPGGVLRINPLNYQKGDLEFKIKSSIEFHPGESVAIIGPTGGGKSTFLEILFGFTPECRENIYIGGQRLTSFSSSSHLEKLRYCPQGNHFLSGPFAQGVLFKEQMTAEDKHIFERLQLDSSFVDSHQFLNERATNLSGGEARRLALARLLIHPGEIHLFDEPTAGLNAEVESLVWDVLFDAFKNKVLICTTHDDQALRRFDRVIRIERGEIVEDRRNC